MGVTSSHGAEACTNPQRNQGASTLASCIGEYTVIVHLYWERLCYKGLQFMNWLSRHAKSWLVEFSLNALDEPLVFTLWRTVYEFCNWWVAPMRGIMVCQQPEWFEITHETCFLSRGRFESEVPDHESRKRRSRSRHSSMPTWHQLVDQNTHHIRHKSYHCLSILQKLVSLYGMSVYFCAHTFGTGSFHQTLFLTH